MECQFPTSNVWYIDAWLMCGGYWEAVGKIYENMMRVHVYDNKLILSITMMQ